MKKITFLVFLFLLGWSQTDAKQIYLNPGGNSLWDQAGAKFSAHFLGGTGNTATFTSFMTPVEGEIGLYEATIPTATSDWTTVIFIRHDSKATAPSWDNKWNQTADLAYNGTKNRYTITGWGSNDGNWSLYDPNNPSVLLSITPSGAYIGQTVTFSATASNLTDPVYVYWVDGTAIAASTFVPTEAKEYQVSVVATGQGGASATDEKTFVAKEVPTGAFIKNAWPFETPWSWKTMSLVSGSKFAYTGFWGGSGYNVNVEKSDIGTLWIPESSVAPAPQKGLMVEMTYDFVSTEATVTAVEPYMAVVGGIVSQGWAPEAPALMTKAEGGSSWSYEGKVAGADSAANQFKILISPSEVFTWDHNFSNNISHLEGAIKDVGTDKNIQPTITLLQGQKFKITVTIADTADVAAYNLKLEDLPTDLTSAHKSDVSYFVNQSGVNVSFDGSAVVELYNVGGQLIDRSLAQDQYVKTLYPGSYILKVNERVIKILK